MDEDWSLDATAVAAVGYFTHIHGEAVQKTLPRFAEAALGKREESVSGMAEFQGVFSMHRSVARASSAGEDLSIVQVEVERMAIDRRLHVGHLSARIVSKSTGAGEPAFRVDIAMEGLTLDGNPIDLKLSSGILANFHTMSDLRERYARDEHFADPETDLFREPDPLGEKPLGNDVRGWHEKLGYVAAAAVRRITLSQPHVVISGNVLRIANFGTIHMAELLISPVSMSITLLRVELGSPLKGRIAVGVLDAKAIRRGDDSRSSPEPDHAMVDVLFATDRATAIVRDDTHYSQVFDEMRHYKIFLPPGYESSGKRHTEFGGERAHDGSLSFGQCRVVLPRQRDLGKLEARSIRRFVFFWRRAQPASVEVIQTQSWTEARFLEQLRLGTAGQREAFVFIHGYNVSFEDAARRAAQLACDLKFHGAPILYSWPSAGSLAAYDYDYESADWSHRHLAGFLQQLAREFPADTIHLIAHSMGNRALTNALEKFVLLGHHHAFRFREVVLAAADVDLNIFEQLAQSIVDAAGRVTVYASEGDRALLASRILHRQPRVGQGLSIENLDAIDSSDVDNGLLRHSGFADNRTVLSDLFYVLEGAPAERRFGLEAVRDQQNQLLYYIFRR